MKILLICVVASLATCGRSMSITLFQCRENLCTACNEDCNQNERVYLTKDLCLKDSPCTDEAPTEAQTTQAAVTKPPAPQYYQCLDKVCQPCAASECAKGQLYESQDDCLRKSACGALPPGVKVADSTPSEAKPVIASDAGGPTQCQEANRTYAVGEAWMSGQFKLQCQPSGVYAIIGCVSLRTGEELVVGETKVVGNWELSCSEVNSQVVIRERFLKGSGKPADKPCEVNGAIHQPGETWISGQFKFECKEDGYKIIGCVSKRFNIEMAIGETKTVENWQVMCDRKGATVFVDETFLDGDSGKTTGGKDSASDKPEINQSLDSGIELCVDSNGKKHPVGAEYVKEQFRFACKKDGEEIIGCISTRTGAELKIGEESTVGGYKLSCLDEGSKVRLTENLIAKDTPDCTHEGVQRANGEKWTKSNIKYVCEDGKVDVYACVDDTSGAEVKIGETKNINGAEVSCSREGDTVSYKKVSSKVGSSECSFGTTLFKSGDEWVKDHLKYKCVEGAYEIIGCVSPLGVELKVGEETTTAGYSISCKEIDGTKVRFEQRPFVKQDDGNAGGNPDACKHEGVTHDRGEMWQYKNFIYKCLETGGYDIIGCVSNRTDTQLRVGETKTVDGIELVCERSVKDNLVILKEAPLTQSQCIFSDNRKLELDELYNDGTFLVKCTADGVKLISCHTADGLVIEAGKSLVYDGFKHNCFAEGPGLFKYVPEVIA